MAHTESRQDEPWLLIEPDPGAFTQLCAHIGAQGVQVEQIQSLRREVLHGLRPLYGIILLMRHKPPDRSYRDDNLTFSTNHNIYFANQVIREAYAVYALLSVVMNCDGIKEIGPELKNLKSLSDEFPSTLKGLSVTNSKALKDANNSIARKRLKHMMRDDDVYHYISYLPIGGHLWELDGFKRGPLRLACTETDWIELARMELQRKTDILQRQRVPFTFWGVVEDRRRVYERQLSGRMILKAAVERQMGLQDPNWRILLRAQQWEDEFNHAIATERRRRNLREPVPHYSNVYRTLDDFPEPEAEQLRAEFESEVQGRTLDELRDLWLQIHDDLLQKYTLLVEEHEKYQRYQDDNTRRQHDYMPFIKAYLEHLLARGFLQRRVSDLPSK
ncbi:hypothetical protein VTP01DRAFT_3063 [Rhizomucor pusillus]|uniref:uncharacterized protein n=1 Tax=Rhizomucor pusillus TaxID=4840 RepID=UPI00374401F1